jgi:hypothetical protein
LDDNYPVGEIEMAAAEEKITRDRIRDAEFDPHVFSQRPPTMGPKLGT